MGDVLYVNMDYMHLYSRQSRKHSVAEIKVEKYLSYGNTCFELLMTMTLCVLGT